jgi:hypothetical protein
MIYYLTERYARKMNGRQKKSYKKFYKLTFTLERCRQATKKAPHYCIARGVSDLLSTVYNIVYIVE